MVLQTGGISNSQEARLNPRTRMRINRRPRRRAEADQGKGGDYKDVTALPGREGQRRNCKKKWQGMRNSFNKSRPGGKCRGGYEERKEGRFGGRTRTWGEGRQDFLLQFGKWEKSIGFPYKARGTRESCSFPGRRRRVTQETRVILFLRDHEEKEQSGLTSAEAEKYYLKRGPVR